METARKDRPSKDSVAVPVFINQTSDALPGNIRAGRRRLFCSAIMKTKHCFFVIICLLLLVGCKYGAAERISGYKRPFNFTSEKIRSRDYHSNAFRSNYNHLVTIGKTDQARTERNEILSELIFMIEAESGNYERNLRFQKSGFDLISDLAQLGLTGAATVTGGAQTKSILAAIATGLKGSELAMNKRIFQDQAVEAIAAQMRAAQNTRKAKILEGMALSIEAYPLDLGLADIVQFYYDGTVTRAMQGLVADARAKETNALDQVRKVQRDMNNR
jgi:hypothetical protein